VEQNSFTIPLLFFISRFFAQQKAASLGQERAALRKLLLRETVRRSPTVSVGTTG
jgi:hypothetical protein